MLVLPWETGRLHRLLATHPERRVEVPEWALPEWDVVTGEKRALPITPPRPADAPPLRPGRARLEDVLRALADAGCAPIPGTEGRWRALCPICHLRGRVDRRVLVVYQPDDGSARTHCFSNSHDDVDLVAALALPSSPRRGRRGFPVEWMR